VSHPTLPPPGDRLAAVADHLDRPQAGVLVEVPIRAGAAVVAEVHAARAVVEALLDMPGRSDHDGLVLLPGEQTVEAWWHEVALPVLHAYDQATGWRWSR
jgi:hypothetical protein